MPSRFVPLVNGEIYHVYNLGLDRRLTFTDARGHRRAIELLKYYSYDSLPLRFSHFSSLDSSLREEIRQNLLKHDRIIHILACCLMPNHFHLLIRQVANGGISKYMANIQNSYTRYFNTRNKRRGSLFLNQFKAVRIESDEQLLHVARYIHLNPYSAYVVKKLEDLKTYPWSTLREYLTQKWNIVTEPETIWAHYGRVQSFKRFIFDQADYQRRLEGIKHLILEEWR